MKVELRLHHAANPSSLGVEVITRLAAEPSSVRCFSAEYSASARSARCAKSLAPTVSRSGLLSTAAVLWRHSFMPLHDASRYSAKCSDQSRHCSSLQSFGGFNSFTGRKLFPLRLPPSLPLLWSTCCWSCWNSACTAVVTSCSN